MDIKWTHQLEKKDGQVEKNEHGMKRLLKWIHLQEWSKLRFTIEKSERCN